MKELYIEIGKRYFGEVFLTKEASLFYAYVAYLGAASDGLDAKEKEAIDKMLYENYRFEGDFVPVFNELYLKFSLDNTYGLQSLFEEYPPSRQDLDMMLAVSLADGILDPKEKSSLLGLLKIAKVDKNFISLLENY